MLINGDAKSLEWVSAVFLSQDEVALKELWYESTLSDADQKLYGIHTANQKKFGLPSRLIAKVFLFRLIYGGSAYSYAADPDFKDAGLNQKQWQNIIDQFYEKYPGLYSWHTNLVRTVTTQGYISIPTGREFHYEPVKKPNGDIDWPRTTILNYPVQGFGADLMMIARLSFRNRLVAGGYKTKLISTVHDSIVCDSPDNEYIEICRLFHEVFRDLPRNFERLFGVELNVPTKCEVLFGKNMSDMKEYIYE
jgi:DNA polymerase I